MASTPLPTFPVFEPRLPDGHLEIVVTHVPDTCMHNNVLILYKIVQSNITWVPLQATLTRVDDIVTEQDLNFCPTQETMLPTLRVPAECSGSNATGITGRGIRIRIYMQCELWQFLSLPANRGVAKELKGLAFRLRRDGVSTPHDKQMEILYNVWNIPSCLLHLSFTSNLTTSLPLLDTHEPTDNLYI
jgi:hypothetical protein